MKTLIYGGRVIDPANGVDAWQNLLIEDGTIVWTGVSCPEADRTMDATGLVVAPGFLDIHMHEDPVKDGRIQQCIFPMMLRQGVTTVLGGNCGGNVYDPVEYLNLLDRDGAAVNVALLAGHEHYRIAAGAEDIYGGASESQLQAMEAGLRHALENGCLGVSFGLRYVPGANQEEFYRAAACCAPGKQLITAHVRDDAAAVFTAIDEVCQAAKTFGLPVQLSHIGSMAGFGQMAQVLQQVDAYREQGLDVTLDCYPYNAFATRLGTPTYDPGWQNRYGCDYDVLEFCDGPYRGQRANKERFDFMRREHPECITVCHVMREEEVRLAYSHPAVMVGSDGITDGGSGHPRMAGTFPRFLKCYAREGELSLSQAIAKITALPAKRLGLSRKGHLGIGADGDITIFDYEALSDRATFQEPALPPVGIRHVLIGGEPVLEDGRILSDTRGRAIRK